MSSRILRAVILVLILRFFSMVVRGVMSGLTGALWGQTFDGFEVIHMNLLVSFVGFGFCVVL